MQGWGALVSQAIAEMKGSAMVGNVSLKVT